MKSDREEFEDAIYARYREVYRGTLPREKFLEKDKGGSYLTDGLSYAWLGWKLGSDSSRAKALGE